MRAKISGFLAGAAALSALTVVGAPAAQAATAVASPRAAHTITFAVPAGRHGATVTANGVSVTVVGSTRPSAVALNCTATVNKPTHSGTVVSGIVTVSCNAVAATIETSAALYYDGSLMAQNNPTATNTSFASSTVTTPYQSGQWKTGGFAGWFDSSGDGQFGAETYSATVTL